MDITDWNDKTFFAEYSIFYLGAASSGYWLNVTGYNPQSTAGDSLQVIKGERPVSHSGRQFSTYDNDNDRSAYENCADQYKGGWWYDHCIVAHPTGVYYRSLKYTRTGITWYTVSYQQETMKFIQFKIRSV